MDVTGSFVDNAGDGTGGNCDEDGETRKTFADTEDENESYQILNGSVILTPGKNFQSDSSDDDSESNIIDEETDNNDKEELNVTKYVFYGVYLITCCLETSDTFQRLAMYPNHGWVNLTLLMSSGFSYLNCTIKLHWVAKFARCPK